MSDTSEDKTGNTEAGFVPDGVADTGNNAQDRSSLMKIIGKAIGLDITTIAIPVTYNEPTSFLQRMMEFVQYWPLLVKANKIVKENPDLALLYVTAFAVSNFAPTERTTKPFNPLLGETFEWVNGDLRYVAEQVSHHPPIGAAHMENEHFVLEQFHHVKTKFLGNSLEISPTGRTVVTLKSTGTRYGFFGVWTTVHNIIIGRMWIDHSGETTVQEFGSKRRVELKFKPCGWFSKGWHEVEGILYDADNKPAYQVAGLWNQNLFATVISGSAKKDSKLMKKAAKKDKKTAKKERKAGREGGADEETKDEDEEIVFEEGKPVLLWQHNIKDSNQEPYKKWGLTEFTVELLKLYDGLPASDSRLRPDRLALEALDYSLSAKEKAALEEAQRERKRQRDARGETYVPKWFRRTTTPEGEEHWAFITDPGESYWDHRAKGFPRPDPAFPQPPYSTKGKEGDKNKGEKEKKDKE